MKRVDLNHISFSRHCFSDVLEFGQMLMTQMAVEFVAVQLSPGPSHYYVDCFELPKKGLWVARTRPLQVEYSRFRVPDGFVMLSSCREKVPVICNGHRLRSSQFSLYPAGATIHAVYADDWDGIDVLASIELLSELDIFIPDLERAVVDSQPLITDKLASETADYLDKIAELIRLASHSGDVVYHQQIAVQLVDHVLDNLREVLRLQYRAADHERLELTRRPDIVARAIDRIFDSPNHPINAERLADELGVSYRLLGYAFRDMVGVSPYQFMLAKRLQDVRRRIKDTRLPVRQVAEQHGFTTPNRFRRQYARLFGELPSETRGRSLRS